MDDSRVTLTVHRIDGTVDRVTLDPESYEVRRGDRVADSLDAAWAEAEAAAKYGITLRGPRDGHRGYMASTQDDYRGFGDTPAAALRALAAKLRERTEPRCLCGTDAALARGETSFARFDIVCPKHDRVGGAGTFG